MSMACTPISASAPPPASCRLREPAGWAPADVHAVAAGLHHLAELTGVDPLAQSAHVGMESPAVSHHQPRPGGFGRGHHQLALGRVHRHRLFHQHVLSRLEEGDRLRRVQGVGCGDHDRVDLAVAHQLLPFQGGAGNPVPLGERRQRSGTPVGGRDQLRRRILDHRAGVEVGDEARAQQCDSDRIGHTGRDYPLTPVSVTPSMNTRWARKKMITIGSMKSSAAAIVRFQLT